MQNLNAPRHDVECPFQISMDPTWCICGASESLLAEVKRAIMRVRKTDKSDEG